MTPFRPLCDVTKEPSDILYFKSDYRRPLANTMPNISLKKLWRRKCVTISEYDPTYKVTYLGNVLTGWAKGDGCIEKPLATLWRNYCQSNRPDIAMKVTICDAGLKAVTKEHGLTEYWAHRVTYCCSHPAYPRVFCWVYRHEGRRLKQELRCHAVLCPKQIKAETMAKQLKARLSSALQEFRREKMIRQNARLSLMHAVYDSGALPLRKVYLITGVSNYRPPLERSKSAPKLSAIEEILEEEEEEDGDGVPQGAQLPPTVEGVESPLKVDQSSPADMRDDAPIVEKEEAAMAASAEVSSVDVSETASDFVFEEDFTSEAMNDPFTNDPFLLEEEGHVALPPQGDGYSVEMNFSSPDLLFYRVPPLDGVAAPDQPKSPSRSMPESGADEIELLTTLSEKLRIKHKRDESLTSDQPESIGSHSCNSSCGGCSDGGTEGEMPLLTEGEVLPLGRGGEAFLKAPLKGDLELDCDNISEESGYSEDKDCLPPTRHKVVV